jgi:putative ABC transport system substrate-binding protein
LAGAAAAWPLAAWAQQADRVRRIGVVESLTERDPEGQARVAALREGLAKLGWVDGRNARFEYRWGAADLTRARPYATELAAIPCDIIFVNSAPVVAIFRDQIKAIPMVFVQTGDPVQADSVQSFAQPGGNLTGFMQYEPTVAGKYLQLLKDIAPNLSHVAVLQSDTSVWRNDFAAVQAVAGSFGITPVSRIAHNDAEIEQAILDLAHAPLGGLIVLPDANMTQRRALIVALVARYGLPAIYPSRVYVAAGGLMAYGVDNADIFRRAASYVDRILKGEKPSALPVQAPTKFDLIINLSAAKALGLNLSSALLMGASEVIE